MSRLVLRCAVGGVVGATVLLCAGTVLGTQTAQERCDQTRVTAWKTYVACIDTVVARTAGCRPTNSCPGTFNEFAAFARCRHWFFRRWAAFQTIIYRGSTCSGSRFTSTAGGTTVTDALTGLVWEQKTGVIGTPIPSDVHDVNNVYTWSTGPPQFALNEDGTAFTTFLGTLNGGAGFAGANGWRLPTLAELQSIVLDFPCTGPWGSPKCSCGSIPCIDGTFGPTHTALSYWSSTSYLPTPSDAWTADFSHGSWSVEDKSNPVIVCVRAVRGGL